MPPLFLCLLVVASVSFQNDVSAIEEFHISSPMDLHGLAMEKFLQYRKDVDPKASLNYDSPLMKTAHDHAVQRLIAKPEHELKLRVCYQNFSKPMSIVFVVNLQSCNSYATDPTRHTAAHLTLVVPLCFLMRKAALI